MIIDSHIHLFSDKIISNHTDYFRDKNFSLLYNNINSKIICAKDILTDDAVSDIDYFFVLGFSWENISDCVSHNEYFKTLKNPRFLKFASVPSKPFDNIDEYFRSLKNDGFIGIGEVSFYHSTNSSEEYRYLSDIFRYAGKNGLIVNMHVNENVGHNYTGKYYTDFRRLYETIQNNRETNIILSHWGGGLLFYELMPEVEKAFSRVYYDTAASPYLYKKDIYKVASQICGSKKILFGSDYPLIKPERYLKEINNTELSENDILLITGLNAENLVKKISPDIFKIKD